MAFQMLMAVASTGPVTWTTGEGFITQSVFTLQIVYNMMFP